MPCAQGGKNRVYDPLDLELKITVSHRVGAGKQTWVLRKGSKRSEPPSHLPSPRGRLQEYGRCWGVAEDWQGGFRGILPCGAWEVCRDGLYPGDQHAETEGGRYKGLAITVKRGLKSQSSSGLPLRLA